MEICCNNITNWKANTTVFSLTINLSKDHLYSEHVFFFTFFKYDYFVTIFICEFFKYDGNVVDFCFIIFDE